MHTTMMNTRKRRESSSKLSVIVILEGIKVCIENTGIAPLRKAARQVNNAEDEVLVLTLLHPMESTGSSSSNAGCRGDQQYNHLCEEDPHIAFLRQEIRHRKEVYQKIFRPFYDNFKKKGVKFQVKIAAGFWSKDVIIEEANNVRATWIVMDSCLTRHVSFQLSGTDCNVSLVSDDDEAIARDHHLDSHDVPKCSMIMEEIHKPTSPKPVNGFMKQEELCVNFSLLHVQQPSSPSILVITSEKNENQTLSEAQQDIKKITNVESLGEEEHDNSPRKFSNFNFKLGQPQQLSWEAIMEITGEFSTKALMGQCKNCMAYLGYLSEYRLFVLVKRYTVDSISILEAEKKAARSMHHKNILGLLGYHQSDNATVLVYPHPREGTLDNTLCSLGKSKLKLKFQQKLKIAIEIAQGVRYMHQECPRATIIHGELQLHNIFLRHDLRPLISGFGQATWLHHEHASISNDRCQLEDSLNHESMELLKSDIMSFGVLLLRLFCRISMPQDSRSLIEWARPLMLQGKFHELLEEELDFSDVHGIYRVMAAATQCTTSKPTSRPCMSEVISILKGENYSAIQSTPSSSNSP